MYFTIEVNVPTILRASISVDGNVKYLSSHGFSHQKVDATWLDNEIKIQLIKNSVYAYYSQDLKFVNLKSFENGLFVEFQHVKTNQAMYFYGYLKIISTNPIFIIRQKYDCNQDVKSLHPAKCDWWSDWHSCTCE